MKISNFKLMEDGYDIIDSGYIEAWDAESKKWILDKVKKNHPGYADIKLYREKTDTKGLKMYVVWAKEGGKNEKL